MFKTPKLDQTLPDGKPALDVGTSFIERLFTKVVQFLSAVMLDPAIKDFSQLLILLEPPNIAEQLPATVFV